MLSNTSGGVRVFMSSGCSSRVASGGLYCIKKAACTKMASVNLFRIVLLCNFLVIVSGGDGTQHPGRSIGLTDEERKSAAVELELEEKRRLNTPQSVKEEKAREELKKLEKKKKKGKSKLSATKPKPVTKDEKIVHKRVGDTKQKTEKEDDLIKEARAIGITDEERKAHQKALEEEEDRRMATPLEEKKLKAQRELEKLNKRTQKTKAQKKKKKKRPAPKRSGEDL
eukprot:m.50377 g.50377  ORF g.50377 m.50377 type:complete len:226 (+) comp10666_c0_seq1:62-739(+)